MAAPPKGNDKSAGMDKAELKKMMMLVKRQTMHCAIALGADGNAAIVMDKMKKGPALDREMKADSPQTKDHRFGDVTVDMHNKKLAIFTINKATAGGMARKLVKALKGTGFNKVKLMLEDGSEVESDEGEPEEDEGEGDEADGANAQDAAGQQPDQAANGAAPDTTQPASSQATQPADSTPAAPPAPDQTAPATDQAAAPATDQTAPAAPPAPPGDANQGQQQGDLGAITKDLTDLVRQMLDVVKADPTQKPTLAPLATNAQAAIKAGDANSAKAAVEQLRDALTNGATQGANPGAVPAAPPPPNGAASANGGAQPDTANAATPPAAPPPPNGAAQPDTANAAPPAAPPPPNGAAPADANGQDAAAKAAPAIAKAKTAWVATRQKIENDLGKLHGAFGDAFKGHDQEQEISKAFKDRVETVLNTFDEELSQTLDSVNKAQNPNDRAQMVQKAHQILDQHRQQIASDDTIKQLDTNPFVPLALAKTLGATLDALSRSIR